MVTDEDTLFCEESEKTSTEPDRCQFAGLGTVQANLKAWCLLRCFRAQLRSWAIGSAEHDVTSGRVVLQSTSATVPLLTKFY